MANDRQPNKKLSNVEIYFPHLDPNKPNEGMSGKKKWDIQVRIFDKDVARKYINEGVPFKLKEDKEGNAYYGLTFSKYVLRTDKVTGETVQNKPVEVVDRKKQPMNPLVIGNGTVANIICNVYKTGFVNPACVLYKVQVVDLKEFIPATFEDDFDVVEDGETTSTNSSNDFDDLDESKEF